ncbi:MAG: hypothetical protein HY315_10600 [Acidobacteria bacterium]|nr:hypothetical protein [Acidobacteriota bacterium]
MVQYTLENSIILHVFQTLLAGLIFLVAAWEGSRQPPKWKRLPLAATFFFFSGFVLLRTLFLIGLEFGYPLLDFSWPFLLLSVLETLSLGYLLVWLAPSRRSKRILMVVVALLVPAYLAGRVRIWGEVAPTFEPFYQGGALHLTLILMALFLARKTFLWRWNLIQCGLLFFAGSYMAEVLFDLNLPQPTVWLWNLQHVAKIAGLLSFALHLEKEGSHIYVQFFLRLNLISILSANIFMLLVSETQRRQYLDFSATQAQDLAEFLRGHVIYFYDRGLKPPEILEREEINHKIVSEFSRIPALKQVKMEVERHQLLMAIDPAGVIAYQAGVGLFPSQRQSIYDYGGMTLIVLRIPVVFQGRAIGFLQFDEDLLILSRKIAKQIQPIFASFTIVVFVTLGALGLIVRKAQKTIRQQYEALQEKQEELVQASRLASIGELVDGVAHEVNNPTGVILIRSECALATLPREGFPSVWEDLEEIRLQAGRMTKLVRTLLAFSRAAPMRAVPVDLNQVVRRSLDLVSAYLAISGIRIELDLAPDLPSIRGDTSRLEQVIVNLVKNAADAMPHGGILSCTTRGNHDFVSLAIADTGAGIPQDILGKIFHPFFTTKAPGQGTGLGLSISAGIVADHGGRIDVQSEPQRGSIFTVHLPVSRR